MPAVGVLFAIVDIAPDFVICVFWHDCKIRACDFALFDQPKLFMWCCPCLCSSKICLCTLKGVRWLSVHIYRCTLKDVRNYSVHFKICTHNQPCIYENFRCTPGCACISKDARFNLLNVMATAMRTVNSNGTSNDRM